MSFVRLCVVLRNVARPNVVRRNVVWPTVGVSFGMTICTELDPFVRQFYAASAHVIFGGNSVVFSYIILALL